MGIGSIFNSIEKRSNIQDYFSGGISGGIGISRNVSENAALGITALWSAVNLISNTIGLFPLVTYKKSKQGKEKDFSNNLYRLLHDSPNEYMSRFEFFQIMVSNYLLNGCGAAEIKYDARGQVESIYPLDPNSITIEKTANDKLVYKVRCDKGSSKILQSYQLILIKYYPKCDGSWLSVIGTHRESLKLQMTVREFGAKTFRDGINPAGIVSGVSRSMNENSRKTLSDNMQNYGGLGNTHKVMLLEEGLSFSKVSINAEDAQFIESMNFSVEEIARIFNVPAILLNKSGTTSWGSGIAELVQGFISLNIGPLCSKIEQEFNRKLVSVDNTETYCKFIMDGLLRGNVTERNEAYVKGIMNGYKSINEVRNHEDLDPIEGGDSYFIPLNLQTLLNAVNNNREENNE